MRPIPIWILTRLLVANARGARGWLVGVPAPGACGCSLAEAGSASLLSSLHVLNIPCGVILARGPTRVHLAVKSSGMQCQTDWSSTLWDGPKQP